MTLMRRRHQLAPEAIYRRSFEIIREEADLTGLSPDAAAIATRVMHASGMTDLVPDLRISSGIGNAVRAAVAGGVPILVDAPMVGQGLSAARLPAATEILCTLGDPEVVRRSAAAGTTRSAEAVSLWRPRLAGSVVVIGNAPTALFALLDLLLDGAEPPAAIFGFPVGFVGAADSKDLLVAEAGAVPYATLLGRRGGSAIAAAAFNACLVGAEDR